MKEKLSLSDKWKILGHYMARVEYGYPPTNRNFEPYLGKEVKAYKSYWYCTPRISCHIPKEDRCKGMLRKYATTEIYFQVGTKDPGKKIWGRLSRKEQIRQRVWEAQSSQSSLRELFYLIDPNVGRLILYPSRYISCPKQEIRITEAHLHQSATDEEGLLKVFRKERLIGLIRWHLKSSDGVLALALSAPIRLLRLATELSPYEYPIRN